MMYAWCIDCLSGVSYSCDKFVFFILEHCRVMYPWCIGCLSGVWYSCDKFVFDWKFFTYHTHSSCLFQFSITVVMAMSGGGGWTVDLVWLFFMFMDP